MKYAQVTSACECQAALFADLNEDRFVLRGWVKDMRRQHQAVAPAHSIHAEKQRFQVAWWCPLCIRNTLRSFDAMGLVWKPLPEPSAQPEAQAGAQ